MGLYRMGPPEALILALKRQLGLANFVETGTYRGDTAAWAAGYFAQVTTIELSPEFHAKAVQRFKESRHVEALAGDSSTVLKKLMEGNAGAAILWLDAHWSGLDTAGRESECPLIGEIALINASRAGHVILVDDARLFCAPPSRPHRAEQWPDLGAVIDALRDGGRRHVVLFEDVFIAVPVAAREFLTAWLQEETTRQRAEGRWAKWWKKIRA